LGALRPVAVLTMCMNLLLGMFAVKPLRVAFYDVFRFEPDRFLKG
jgi:hypothetical protein